MYDSSHNPREPLLNLPAAVGWLIGANLAVHILLWLIPAPLDWQLKAYFAFVPAHWTAGAWSAGTLVSPLTHQFLHAGAFHLAVNMLILAAFGSAVARAFGTGRFFLLYFLAGLGGAALHGAFYPASTVPTLGASGAISGLFAAALLILAADPRNRAAGMRFWPAAAIWVAMSVIVGLTDLPSGRDSGGVAWAAHLGGFFVGGLLTPLLRRAGPGGIDPHGRVGERRRRLELAARSERPGEGGNGRDDPDSGPPRGD